MAPAIPNMGLLTSFRAAGASAPSFGFTAQPKPATPMIPTPKPVTPATQAAPSPILTSSNVGGRVSTPSYVPPAPRPITPAVSAPVVAKPAIAAAPSVPLQKGASGTVVNPRTGGVVTGYSGGDGGAPATPATPSAPEGPDPNSLSKSGQYVITGTGDVYDTNTNTKIDQPTFQKLGLNADLLPKVTQAPQQTPEQAYGSASDAYQQAQKVTPEEEQNSKDLSALNTSYKSAYLNTEGQPIPLQFITGQQKALENRKLALEQPLKDTAALLQAKRTGNLNASKYALDKAAQILSLGKPVSVAPGSSLVNPLTGVSVANNPKYQATTDAFGNPVVVKLGPGGGAPTPSPTPKPVGAFSSSNLAGSKTTPAPAGGKSTAGLSFAQYGLLANTNFNPSNTTDQLAQKYLDSYIKNGTVPTATTLGRGIKPGAMGQIDQRARDLYFAATGNSLPTPEIIKGYQGIINNNNKMANNLKIQEQTVSKNIDLSLANLKKNNLNSASFKPLNNFLNTIDDMFNDPAVGQLIAQNSTIQNELGSLLAVKNASGTTVYDKMTSAGIITNADNASQIKAKVSALLKEATNFADSISSANADAYKLTDPFLQDSNNPLRTTYINNNAGAGGSTKTPFGNNNPLGI